MCGAYSLLRREETRYKFWVGKLEGKRQLGRPRLDGRVILKWNLRK
jgi:hypothetical protein